MHIRARADRNRSAFPIRSTYFAQAALVLRGLCGASFGRPADVRGRAASLRSVHVRLGSQPCLFSATISRRPSSANSWIFSAISCALPRGNDVGSVRHVIAPVENFGQFGEVVPNLLASAHVIVVDEQVRTPISHFSSSLCCENRRSSGFGIMSLSTRLVLSEFPFPCINKLVPTCMPASEILGQ